jgi:hypothetical protein
MSRPDPAWQRETSLSKIATLRKELELSARPVSEQYLAEQGAKYVGATAAQVLAWMRGRP